MPRKQVPQPQYRVEEPQTQQYIAQRADGSHSLADRDHPPLEWTLRGDAETYSSTRLHGTPHEIVRVDPL